MTSLDDLLAHYVNDERIIRLEKHLEHAGASVSIKNAVGSLPAFIGSAIFTRTSYCHIFVMDDWEDAAYFENDLSSLLEKKEVIFFPNSYKKPGFFDELNNNQVLTRTQALNKLVNRRNTPELLVTYPEAILEKIVKAEKLKENTLHLKTGEKIDLDFILDLLIEYGFERTDFVYEPGEFSIRGGIVDIFSFGNEYPYRVELFGNEVESLRTFDVENQLSLRKISELTIIPNIQTHFTKEIKATIFDFLPENTVFWIKSPDLFKDALVNLYEKATFTIERANLLSAKEEHPFKNKPIDDLFEPPDLFINKLFSYRHITLSGRISAEQAQIIFNSQPQPSFNRNFDLFIATLNDNVQKDVRNIIFAENPRQIERFYHIFNDLNAKVNFIPIYKNLAHGFTDTDAKIACYTDHQVFERYNKYKIKSGFSRGKALTIKALRDLVQGDYVVHIDHGVGVFSGLQRLEINGQIQEMVRLIYRDNDVLYVNIHSLHKISKYSGKEGTTPKVNKLGSDAWANLKRKTKSKVKDIARELIRLYAQRKLQKGFAFSPDNYMQDELEASFMYEDTPDQVSATIDVKLDMEKPTPMDRLICGDVGFGKTEIAMRAAFKAVLDGKQVAILVPTTILAWQHYQNFKKRFQDFPVTVDYISRFKSQKEKTNTLQLLSEGKVDVLIGTHAILGKAIKFKDCGLLIIDEEQKFGVAAKEKLRAFSVGIDTLTLTATPIPRTLKFSLMGARDLSNITTPPPNRQPVTTEVKPFDPSFIKEAIEYEVFRGGQVFFVHNRVKDIYEFETLLKRLLPNVSIATAHGQMDGDRLEEVMMDFINGKFDVLLSTNIVESGLDIANANTMIVHNAHQFGLSDLHQLRGRVGRSNKKAFCYLIAPPKSTLSVDARRRLQTLEEFSELGSGFQIAMRDLDIRGAGNLLGGEQSGFIAEIGFEMYHRILDEAIQELKFTEFKDVFQDQMEKKQDFVSDCSIDTDIEMLIPNEYVSNPDERLKLYAEIDNINDEETLQKFHAKMEDRFGKVPLQVEELLDGLRLRWMAKRLGFERIILKNRKLRCYFIENPESPYYDMPIFGKVVNIIQQQKHKANLKQSNQNLILIYDQVKSMQDAEQIFVELVKSLEEMV
ncbi:MAG: transcription-repair coupling factor [Chitinophagales bacterium]|nr:transcription-repair coupling factor [Chitinophagales bacterium]